MLPSILTSAEQTATSRETGSHRGSASTLNFHPEPGSLPDHYWQTVFHFHIHLIPRYKGGERIVANWTQTPLPEEWKDEVLAKLN